MPLLTGNYLRVMPHKWRDIEFQFIDEISIVTYEKLCVIDSHLNQLKNIEHMIRHGYRRSEEFKSSTSITFILTVHVGLINTKHTPTSKHSIRRNFECLRVDELQIEHLGLAFK